MKFLLDKLFHSSASEGFNLIIFRFLFCSFLIWPVLLTQLPIGSFRPITFVEWTGITIETNEQLIVLKLALVVSLILAAIGVRARVFLSISALLLLILASNIYSYLYDPVTKYMPQEFNLAWFILLVLVFSPQVSALKISDFRKPLNPFVTSEAWPRYLILFSLGWVYFSAFTSKYFFGAWTFGSAETLRGYLLEFGLFRQNDTSIWLAQQPFLSHVATLSTLLFELTALIGFLYRRTRLIYGLIGMIFHISVFVFFGIDFFTKYLPVYFILVDWSRFQKR